MNGANDERFGAELVGKLDPNKRAAKRDMDDLAQGGVSGTERGCAGCGVRAVEVCGGPGADPVVGRGFGFGGKRRGGQDEAGKGKQESASAGCAKRSVRHGVIIFTQGIGSRKMSGQGNHQRLSAVRA